MTPSLLQTNDWQIPNWIFLGEDWDPDNGWSTEESTESATTTFDVEFNNGRCAFVQVAKDTSTTTIISRGYNTCDENDSRRVERALEAHY